MAAITIDSPRWRDGWGDSVRHPQPVSTRPELRVVAGSGSRRTDVPAYRRRRLVALVAALVVVVAIVVGVSSFLGAPASAGAPAVGGRVTHVVQPGETYWSIAAGLEHEGDLRVFVDRLVDANGARTLVPGDRIEVPQP